MEKHCEFCGEPMAFSRSTKKYCSDNCKQLAFYSRQGADWGRNFQQLPVIVKLESDRSSFTLNGNDQKNKNSPATDMNNENENSSAADGKLLCTKNFTVSDNLLAENKDKLPQAQRDQQGKPLTVKMEKVIETYDWIESSFLNAIERHRRTYYLTEYMFRNPQKYWHTLTLKQIGWVTTRLRCLVENLIRLSDQIVDRRTLQKIAGAFTGLADTIKFRYLPSNYPFRELTLRLKEQFSEMVEHLQESELLLRFSPNLKTELVAVRFMIGNAVPKRRFSELQFGDEPELDEADDDEPMESEVEQDED